MSRSGQPAKTSLDGCIGHRDMRSLTICTQHCNSQWMDECDQRRFLWAVQIEGLIRRIGPCWSYTTKDCDKVDQITGGFGEDNCCHWNGIRMCCRIVIFNVHRSVKPSNAAYHTCQYIYRWYDMWLRELLLCQVNFWWLQFLVHEFQLNYALMCLFIIRFGWLCSERLTSRFWRLCISIQKRRGGTESSLGRWYPDQHKSMRWNRCCWWGQESWTKTSGWVFRKLLGACHVKAWELQVVDLVIDPWISFITSMMHLIALRDICRDVVEPRWYWCWRK